MIDLAKANLKPFVSDRISIQYQSLEGIEVAGREQFHWTVGEIVKAEVENFKRFKIDVEKVRKELISQAGMLYVQPVKHMTGWFYQILQAFLKIFLFLLDYFLIG